MSKYIQYILMSFYVVLTITSIIEHNLGKTLYWVGAIVLLTGVILMK